MPVKKGEAGVKQVMREYSENKLHSGSSHGPEVKSRKQAVAIALKQSGMSYYNKKGEKK